MYLATKIRNFLRRTRQLFGSRESKKRLWDQEYAAGRWNHCDDTPGAAVYALVEKYGRQGSILDLGCGSGNTGNELAVGKYRSYTGVDVSEVATRMAAQRSEKNGRTAINRFKQGDITEYVPDQAYDVILFRESVYYIPIQRIKPALDRLSASLLEGGVFIVDLSRNGTKLFDDIVSIIEANYDVVERQMMGDFAAVLVFRQKRLAHSKT